jgi:hypothetical protein
METLLIIKMSTLYVLPLAISVSSKASQFVSAASPTPERLQVQKQQSVVVPLETSAHAGGSMESCEKNVTFYRPQVVRQNGAVNYSRLFFSLTIGW